MYACKDEKRHNHEISTIHDSLIDEVLIRTGENKSEIDIYHKEDRKNNEPSHIFIRSNKEEKQYERHKEKCKKHIVISFEKNHIPHI